MKGRFFSMLITVLLVSLISFQCSKEDSGKQAKIDGVVSLPDGTAADGAIVIISSSPNAVNVITKVVADTAGMYSIPGISEGTYYLSARYNSANQNNLKSTGINFESGEEIQLNVGGSDISQNITLVANASTGTSMVEIADGEFAYDNTHSTIYFEFPYDAENAVFSGHFGRAGLDELYFSEADPASIEIKAWVDLASIETGSAPDPCGHTRDGIEGCIMNTFSVELDPADTVDITCKDGTVVTSWPNETLEPYDLWGDASTTTYQKQSALMGNSGVATLVAKSVSAYGDGYLALCDFSFAGFTKEVDMYMKFIEGYEDEEGNLYSSFYAWFSFAAFADYEISSGHVGNSDVTVKLSIQLEKAI